MPNNLDTVNVYKLVKEYESGKLIYPVAQRDLIMKYLKFSANGRCLSFSLIAKNSSYTSFQLKESDLNPNDINSRKKYYFSKDGKNIEIESFVYGEGYGLYTTLNYVIDNSGDTITYTGPYTKSIYVKEKIPATWKKYKVDW